MPSSPRFSGESIAFLRALKRHNDRDWFRAHRDAYEAHVRGPMVAVVERLATDLPTFAPELVASPRASIYRIYRDTRFSADKSPFKTHVAATFPPRELPKHEGAGLYFHLAPDELLIAGGLYRPQPVQLHQVREHIRSNFTRLRAIVEADTFKRAFGAVDGERLQRVPLGFPRDHPAAEYLKLRQFLAWCERPVTLATSARFYPTLIQLFKHLYPFIRFVNEPILAGR